jgi:hypothetical protein
MRASGFKPFAHKIRTPFHNPKLLPHEILSHGIKADCPEKLGFAMLYFCPGR